MGAGVSAGENNDDLIDNLIEATYIKTSSVERVFRAVDRGAYFLPDPPADAYRDVAWKNGNFHISAPCIYSQVMEGLKLRPGLSFLNLGSGTGYFNTVAGLVLGSYGLNHGIELHEDVIQYAYTRLEEFKKHSGAIDEYDFCEPKFMQGNCLSLASGYHLYDRVYCGAACLEKYVSYMKNLIKVGGILVVPINDRLVEIRRVSETNWTTHYLLAVSFTNLVEPKQGNQETVPLFDIEPLSLQELCRTSIRSLLRKIVETEHPNVKNVKKTRKNLKKKKPVKRNGRKDTRKTSEELLDFFLLTIARKKERAIVAAAHDRENSSSSANNDDTDPPSSDSDDDSSIRDELEMQEAFSISIFDRKTCQHHASTSNCHNTNETEEASSSKAETESKAIVHREDESESNDEQEENKVSCNVTVEPMVVEEDEVKKREENNISEVRPKNNRDKFDSGLGDELLISELPVDMVEAMSSSSSNEDQDNKRCKRGLKEKEKRLSSKWRKLDEAPKKCDSDSSDNEDKSDSESEYVEAMNRMKMYISPYSVHMKSKIQQLPLPSNVKKFLNYYREF